MRISVKRWKISQVPLPFENASLLTGGSGELHTCQSGLGARESYGADHLEGDLITCSGHQGNQAQPAWVIPDQPDIFL